jgi:hypothetical protein
MGNDQFYRNLESTIRSRSGFQEDPLYKYVLQEDPLYKYAFSTRNIHVYDTNGIEKGTIYTNLYRTWICMLTHRGIFIFIYIFIIQVNKQHFYVICSSVIQRETQSAKLLYRIARSI